MIGHDGRFALLQSRYRRIAVPIVASFLGWYFLYVTLSAFARSVMDRRILGNLNIAFFFGVFQFVSTFGIAWAYSRYSRDKIDPLAEKIKDIEPQYGHGTEPQYGRAVQRQYGRGGGRHR
jgi:uncharacterized membrane protein (DUF485 family)